MFPSTTHDGFGGKKTNKTHHEISVQQLPIYGLQSTIFLARSSDDSLNYRKLNGRKQSQQYCSEHYRLSIAACETKEHKNTIAGSINSYTHQVSHMCDQVQKNIQIYCFCKCFAVVIQNVFLPKHFPVRKENTVNNSRAGWARVLPETMTHKIDVKGSIVYSKGIIKDPSFFSNSLFYFAFHL